MTKEAKRRITDHSRNNWVSIIHPTAFPFCPQSGLLSLFTRLLMGSLALRPALLLFGNSRPRVTTTPLPHATGAYGQLPRRDFNPLDLLLLLRTNRPQFFSQAPGSQETVVCPPFLTSGTKTRSVEYMRMAALELRLDRNGTFLPLAKAANRHEADPDRYGRVGD